MNEIDLWHEAENFEYADEGKFKGMQGYFINWVANLDGKNRQRLSDAINNHKEM